jgi:hypothetical protein
MPASLGALALAAAAIVGAYATSHRTTSVPAQTGVGAVAASESDTAPALLGAFPAEPGPEGTVGQWVGDAASVTVADFQRSWIAFRAASLRRPRTLTMVPSSGPRLTVRIGTRPALYVVGPFREGVVSLLPRPRAAVASPHDPRQVSVFVSALRTYPRPLAALPGAGFWGVESAQGVSFNWLRDDGVVDVYSPGVNAGPIWLTFVGRSLGEDRTLTVSSGQTTRRVRVGMSARLIRIGPFPLARGQARLLLSPSPGARRYPGDPRSLSVQVALLAAHTSATEG